MSAIPPHSGRPAPSPADAADEKPPEFESTAQPPSEDRVMDDMATLAINPRLLENHQTTEAHLAAGLELQHDGGVIHLAKVAGS